MLFWLFCAALVIMVAIAILAPMLRGSGRGMAESAAAYDLQVYRDQLREVERDLTREVISEAEAARLRLEIGRKVLDADRRVATAEVAPSAGRTGVIGATLAIAAVMAGAVALYLREGAPGVADLPLTARIASAEASYRDRPSQAEAEAAAPAPSRPDIDTEYTGLIEQLREAVAKAPDDPQGLALLSTHETRLGNLAAAMTAQRHLIEVKGADVTAFDHLMLVTQLIEAAGGLITAEAETELAKALKLEPQNGHARFLLGLMQIQNGRPDRAFPLWRDLLAEGPEDARWIAPIRTAMPELAWLAGQPDYVAPEPAAALPGPDADAVAAAGNMTEAERTRMIAGMVERLEARLATEGGSPEEWARLISALVVQERADHARDIWAEAQTRFASQPEALAVVQAAAKQAGLVE